MKYKGIILCGAPASGKTTLTKRLCKLNSSIYEFKKYRGSEPVLYTKEDEYINISKSKFEKLILYGEIKSYLKEYSRYYGISDGILDTCQELNQIYVLHYSDIKEVEEFLNVYGPKENYLKVLLTTPKTELENRLNIRHNGNKSEIKERIKVVDRFIENTHTKENMEKFDLCLNNVNLDKTVNTILSKLSWTNNIITR